MRFLGIALALALAFSLGVAVSERPTKDWYRQAADCTNLRVRAYLERSPDGNIPDKAHREIMDRCLAEATGPGISHRDTFKSGSNGGRAEGR